MILIYPMLYNGAGLRTQATIGSNYIYQCYLVSLIGTNVFKTHIFSV